MLHEKKPCLDCEKRTVGCHSSCKEYKDFREELDIKNQLKRDAQQKRNIINGYCYDVKSKRCKRQSDKVKYKRER